MSNINSLDVKNILKRFKKVHGIKTDAELARILGVKPNTIAMWKVRNYIDMNLLIAHNLHSLDYIIMGRKYEGDKSHYVSEQQNNYTADINLKHKIKRLELENAELKGQVKILKELLMNKRSEK